MSCNPIFDELAEASGLVLDSEQSGTESGKDAVPEDQEELAPLPVPRHAK